ncbi:YdcF family protein [Acetobacter farinalis]|uniref:YdcF family protein n=1 Tax=Acetobacter farinalis TaxID=1260984 RepID=A0ABT3Q548_9PROT|nr:YdcF family protein [Acetobacter farinalis]MCX2560369.1 YdcF family protein [Acetobacter farinalis]NHO29024.1 YdcF family protein [Acetobacter farinalis]
MTRAKPRLSEKTGESAVTPIIIFGAALRADGSPSPALQHRVQAAVQFGAHQTNPLYLVTGGVPRAGHTEAAVMHRLLTDAGVAPEKILVEPAATDTFDSILYCTKILQEQSLEECTLALATSTYHMPRCLLLMRLAGWRVRAVPFPFPLMGRESLFRTLVRIGHEILASAWDAFLVLRWRIVR